MGEIASSLLYLCQEKKIEKQKCPSDKIASFLHNAIIKRS